MHVDNIFKIANAYPNPNLNSVYHSVTLSQSALLVKKVIVSLVKQALAKPVS
jgi:hypothetical protein